MDQLVHATRLHKENVVSRQMLGMVSRRMLGVVSRQDLIKTKTWYHSRSLLGACVYISTGRKYPISEICLNSFILIRSFFDSVGSKMAEFLGEDFSA